MVFSRTMEHVAQAFEVIGVLILAVGLGWSIVLARRTWRSAGGRRGYKTLRDTFGGVLLLGLEMLVAADLIHTIAVAPTLQNVAGLGVIVVIRTFLSFSIQVEIEGVPPWRRALTSGATVAGRAARQAGDAAPADDH